tara:strand:- start:66 stop:338 length:273 start_codon:yes stop_codon:yes gene_type:complete
MILENMQISATFKVEDGSVHTEVFKPYWGNTSGIDLDTLSQVIDEDILENIVKKHRLQYPENVKIKITFEVEDFIDADLEPLDKYNFNEE